MTASGRTLYLAQLSDICFSSVVESVPHLQPGVGDLLEVVITIVSQLDQFIVQLYGQEIVLLSQQLR